ncbi:MAG: serine/threonine protein kinase [Gemmataceae bacterium]|nr:serine/threonine protein kinase [Gemmataceae bacterium]
MIEQSTRADALGFIENVFASGLMDREELASALDGFPETDRAKVVARHLVETGRLTKFQAEKLLSGRTDGFLLGQYRVLEELGRGGMGRVYKAVHQAMGRFVALKLLAPDLTKTDKARELFEREVKAAARLNHPNIVTAYDANHAGDRFFLVMEYVDGPNLSQLVKEHGALPIEQACEYIRQSAVGLDYAHEMGLIHRDVKPSNLLVQQTTTGPQIKILDFGLALVTAGEGVVGEARTGVSNTVLGTPDYVSPEQAKNQYNVDGRSDLYSLGCTFYYLLTGEPPFSGGTAIEKIVRHGTDSPVAIQSKRGSIPDAVAQIVHKLLEKNPTSRYQKAGELATDLAAVVGKKADWSAPARPAPKRRADAGVSLSAGEDPFDDIELEEQPSSNTLPTAMMSTKETQQRLFELRKRRQEQVNWPWILVSILLAAGVVAGVGLAVRYFINQAPLQ